MKLFLLLIFISITAGETKKRPRWIHPRLPAVEKQSDISRQLLKSTSQIPVSEGSKYNFTVYDFTDPYLDPTPTRQLPATARFKQNCNNIDVTVWMEDAAYESSSINNLNDDKWSRDGSLKNNRDHHIRNVIGPAICDIILPETQNAFGAINELSGQVFSGINFLLYDIPDDYDVSESYFAGYFDSYEQSDFNLLHMDIYPGNPAGRTSLKNAPRNEFFHVLAHELQHLIHHQKRQPHPSSAWLDEGLAQFAIYRVLNGKYYPYGTELIFDAKTETPGQVYWYLKDNASHNVRLFQAGESFFSIEYYGFAYLFYTHLWQSISSDTTMADAFMRRLVTEPVDGPVSFNNVLADYGFSLEDVFSDFALSQYMDGLHYDLNFANLDNESVRRFQSTTLTIDNNSLFLPVTLVSNLRNYSTAYIPIKKNSNYIYTVNLRSECHPTLTKYQCDPNNPPGFNVISLPTLEKITASLYPSNLFRKYSGNNISIPIKEHEQTLLFHTIQNSSEWNGINIKLHSINATSEQTIAVFNSLPDFNAKAAALQVSYEATPKLAELSPELYFRTHRFHKWQKITESILSLQKQDIENPALLSWNYYEKTTAANGLLGQTTDNEIKIKMELAETSLEKSFISSFELMTSAFQFGCGWNMLAWFPAHPRQNLGDFFGELSAKINLDPVFYSYKNGSFHCHELSEGACSALTETTVPFHTEIPEPGTGFFIKSLENKEIIFEHLKPARRRLNLNKGWNLGSLFYESQNIKPSAILTPRSLISYYFDAQTNSWKRIYSGIGKNLNTALSTEQQSISLMQAHWIHNAATEIFTAPLPALQQE